MEPLAHQVPTAPPEKTSAWHGGGSLKVWTSRPSWRGHCCSGSDSQRPHPSLSSRPTFPGRGLDRCNRGSSSRSLPHLPPPRGNRLHCLGNERSHEGGGARRWQGRGRRSGKEMKDSRAWGRGHVVVLAAPPTSQAHAESPPPYLVEQHPPFSGRVASALSPAASSSGDRELPAPSMARGALSCGLEAPTSARQALSAAPRC